MVKSDDFLKIVYKKHQDKMRWHSEIEYRLLKMFIIINPVIITAIIGINQYIPDKSTYFVLVCSMVSFLAVLTIFITIKIYYEHKTYEGVGQDVVRIWEYFELFEKGSYLTCNQILTDKAKEYGKGGGYIKTLFILWSMTITIVISLLLFGYSQFLI